MDVEELRAMARLAMAHTRVLADAGATNSCVHTSLAAEAVLQGLGFRVEAVVGDITIEIPNAVDGDKSRFVSTSPSAQGAQLAPGSMTHGYEHHGFVVGQEGFLDLAASALDVFDRPVILPWQAVSFDWKELWSGGYNPYQVLHGDIWVGGFNASRRAVRGAGLPMAVIWSIRPERFQPLTPRPPQTNFRMVEKLIAGYRATL